MRRVHCHTCHLALAVIIGHFHNIGYIAVERVTDLLDGICVDIFALHELCDGGRTYVSRHQQVFLFHIPINQELPELFIGQLHFITSTVVISK